MQVEQRSSKDSVTGMQMRLAVLIRGHNFLEEDRFKYPMDARNNVRSLMDKLIGPIRAANPDAKIYLATYESPALAELKNSFDPCELILFPKDGSSQLDTYKESLKQIFLKDDYDALVVARFDLEFKKGFDTWNLDIQRDSIYFPWKEYQSYWRDHRRVGDAVHIIGKSAIPAFHSAIIMCQLAGRTHLHLLYYFLRTMHSNLRFIEEGYWDSNTFFANPECANPLYKIFNRPRIDQMASNTGMYLGEIRAE
jgi:hypothetical protein